MKIIYKFITLLCLTMQIDLIIGSDTDYSDSTISSSSQDYSDTDTSEEIKTVDEIAFQAKYNNNQDDNHVISRSVTRKLQIPTKSEAKLDDSYDLSDDRKSECADDECEAEQTKNMYAQPMYPQPQTTSINDSDTKEIITEKANSKHNSNEKASKESESKYSAKNEAHDFYQNIHDQGYTSEQNYESERKERKSRRSSKKNKSDKKYEKSAPTRDHRIITGNFFIEKPNANMQTVTFSIPTIFEAETIKGLGFLRNDQLRIINPKEYKGYLFPKRNFIQCNGPIGELSDYEYKALVQELLPEFDQEERIRECYKKLNKIYG